MVTQEKYEEEFFRLCSVVFFYVLSIFPRNWIVVYFTVLMTVIKQYIQSMQGSGRGRFQMVMRCFWDS